LCSFGTPAPFEGGVGTRNCRRYSRGNHAKSIQSIHLFLTL
jgi:hypothetical protein